MGFLCSGWIAGSRNPALSAKQTERLYKGQPDREALARLNLSVTADAVPPPLPRGGLGIPQSFTSSPEAPLLGELSAKQTERLYEGKPALTAMTERPFHRPPYSSILSFPYNHHQKEPQRPVTGTAAL